MVCSNNRHIISTIFTKTEKRAGAVRHALNEDIRILRLFATVFKANRRFPRFFPSFFRFYGYPPLSANITKKYFLF